MSPRTTLELIDITKQPEVSHPIGMMVEVIYDLPAQERKIAYLGTVATRPEDKAKQTVVTNKYGPERIMTMAETYTLTTISKTIHQYVETDDGPEIIESKNSEYVADLIFDPTNPAFTIKPVPELVPQPRIQL